MKVFIIIFIILYIAFLVKSDGWKKGLFQGGLVLGVALLATQNEVLGLDGEIAALGLAVLAMVLILVVKNMKRQKG